MSLRKALLLCGILSMIWYIAINVIVPMHYPGYSIVSQTVSELSAIDAPTRLLWWWLCLPYSILFVAFGFGVALSAAGDRRLWWTGLIIIFDGVFGFFWPPMHQREVIAAGGGALTDTLHLVWAFVHLLLMLLMIGLGAAASGKSFRIFSGFVVIAFILFGTMTARESAGIEAGLPTHTLGIWERVNIAAYMLWVVVFAIRLVRSKYPEKLKNS